MSAGACLGRGAAALENVAGEQGSASAGWENVAAGLGNDAAEQANASGEAPGNGAELNTNKK